VGRLEPVKNPLALVEAVARLRDENVPVELWIVGDGSQRAELEKRIEKHALQKNARLFGYRKNPIDYVSQCDLYVQPSLSEGFGIALVEAMGCGVPVLATSVGGAPEIITHGETGWLIDQPDASGLYKALIKIWRQRQNLPAIGVAGRLAVQGRFEPTAYIEELDFLYSSLLAGKPQEIAN
jgi:glycosyltransferase involved in cell wall biosynthesis